MSITFIGAIDKFIQAYKVCTAKLSRSTYELERRHLFINSIDKVVDKLTKLFPVLLICELQWDEVLVKIKLSKLVNRWQGELESEREFGEEIKKWFYGIKVLLIKPEIPVSYTPEVTRDTYVGFLR